MTRYGTSHFVDRAAAEAYYCGVRTTFTRGPLKGRTVVRGGMGYRPCHITEMLTNGTIHLGTPTLPPGGVLSVIASEGRYQITIPDLIAA